MLNDHTQLQLLRYLTQDPRGFALVESLPLTTFDLVERQLVLNLLQEYHRRFGGRHLPPRGALTQLLADEPNVTPDVLDLVTAELADAYQPPDGGVDLYHEKALHLAQRKLTLDLLRETAPSVTGDEAKLDLDRVVRSLQRIASLGLTVEGEPIRSLLSDPLSIDRRTHRLLPTYMPALNALTSAGGFYAPQLVVFMGGPKAFKTGLGLNLAANYIMEGHPTFWADFENGTDEIHGRLIQRLLRCTEEELLNMDTVRREPWDLTLRQVLEGVLHWMRKLGADLKIKYFPALTAGVDAVASELDHLAMESGWKPDVVWWDYADLVASHDRRQQDERFRLRDVYHGIVRMNNERDTMSATFSQVRREAVDRQVINLTDFAEDFKKAANCHAAFAICRTDEELQAGLGRLVPVVQRKGARYNGSNEVYLEFDEATQYVGELGQDARVRGARTDD